MPRYLRLRPIYCDGATSRGQFEYLQLRERMPNARAANEPPGRGLIRIRSTLSVSISKKASSCELASSSVTDLTPANVVNRRGAYARRIAAARAVRRSHDQCV